MVLFVVRDLWRNPRRTLAAVLGVTLGVGLFAGVLFFVDASGATMTQRAVAPLSLDVQAVLGSPLGRRLQFEERVSAPTPLQAGQDAVFTLTVINGTDNAIHEVVVNDEPPAPLSYVQASMTLNGQPLPEQAGQSPLAQGLARTGFNAGTLAPGGRITFTYRARANTTVASVKSLRLTGTVSSREDVVPIHANSSALLTLDELRARILQIPGVAAADGLSFVDLPPGSLHTPTSRGGTTGTTDTMIEGPVRVFAFGRSYQQHYPSIRVVSGSFVSGSAVASGEAARALRGGPGTFLSMQLPGRSQVLRMPVSGVADFSQAQPLFSSRKVSKLDDFLYVPLAVVVPPATFRNTVVPAFRVASAAQGTIIKNLPVSEVDVLVDRSLLRADPATALKQTKAIAQEMRRIAPGQYYLIDNISNALEVASDDARVGKRMFLFLGLPGMFLAAFLTAFGANIHANAQRREQATLRLHGADRRFLMRLLSLKAVAIAGSGAILGTGLGIASVVVILGRQSVFAASDTELAMSALIAVSAGVLITAVTLYVLGRRALLRDVSDERKEFTPHVRPMWHRFRLDFVLLGVTAIALAAQTYAAGTPAASVSAGRSVSLPSRLLISPFTAWVGGTLVSVRLIQAMTSHLAVATPPRFGPLLRGMLGRSLRRRSWSLATGTVSVALVIAFGTNLAIFAAAYDAAKVADSTFVVGSDLRITPSVQSVRPHPPGYGSVLKVGGVAAVTPVVFKLENSVLIGQYDQDRTDLAAIDPGTFKRVASLVDSSFEPASSDAVMSALSTNPNGLLVRTSRADDFSIQIGDEVQVLLARGTKQQALRTLHVVGLFETLPGFPQGVDLVANIATYTSATGLTQIDFFLARTSEGQRGVDRAVTALRSGPGRNDPMRIDTTATTLNKDQSSLTAVNVRGLLDLGSVYAMAMGAAAIFIVVFGLLLQRRKEYLTLRAYGLSTPSLLVLVIGEAMTVAACGLAAGIAVGVVMAHLFVQVLRPLFILSPPSTIAFGRLVVLGGVLLTSTMASGLFAVAVLLRLKLTTILREP